MIKKLTCIVCPMGCLIEVGTGSDNKIEYIKGNSCTRGEKYARSEVTAPMRTVTSTVLTENGMPVPVKTSKPVPKEKVSDCMKIINATKVVLPITVGDVIIKNILGTDADIVATSKAYTEEPQK